MFHQLMPQKATLFIVLVIFWAFVASDISHGNPRTLAQKVYNKHTNTLTRADVQEVLPDVLNELRDPEAQAFLNESTIELILANPDILIAILPDVGDRFIRMLKTDAQIKKLMRDADFQKLLQDTAAINALVGLMTDNSDIGNGTPPPPSVDPGLDGMKENTITNELPVTIYVTFATWLPASGDVTAEGYRTAGYYPIPPGGSQTFRALQNNPIFFRFQRLDEHLDIESFGTFGQIMYLSPAADTTTVSSWVPYEEDADAANPLGIVPDFESLTYKSFNIVTPTLGTATRGQIKFTDVPRRLLGKKDGFIRYPNGSHITVTREWRFRWDMDFIGSSGDPVILFNESLRADYGLSDVGGDIPDDGSVDDIPIDDNVPVATDMPDDDFSDDPSGDPGLDGMKENIITNELPITIYITFATWLPADRRVPVEGYRTVGYYGIRPGGSRTFYALRDNPIFFRFQRLDEFGALADPRFTYLLPAVNPPTVLSSWAPWLTLEQMKAIEASEPLFDDGFGVDFESLAFQSFNIVTPTFGTAVQGQISFTDVPMEYLKEGDGFIRYSNGSDITVTNQWQFQIIDAADGREIVASADEGLAHHDLDGMTDDLFDSPIVNIPDFILRSVIAETLGKRRDDPISRAEMQTLTKLSDRNINNTNIGFGGEIGDLTGLEFAFNLESLSFSEKNISDVSSLAHLRNLKELSLRDNQISDVSPLAGLRNLESLHLGHNQISDVSPLAGLRNLESLHLGHNQISDVSPLSSLRGLTNLSLGYNKISDVSPLAALENLQILGLRANEIYGISQLAGLINLTKLTLGFNQISQISDLSDLTTLQELHLGNNRITYLSPLRRLENLRVLYLGNNKISEVSELSGLQNLTKLHLTANQISEVSPLSDLRNLKELHLDYNRIVNFRPIDRLVNNLTIYVNSPQLKSLTPASVEVLGPTSVTSLQKRYTFTVVVKNSSGQPLGNVVADVGVHRKDRRPAPYSGQYYSTSGLRTNGAGKMKFRTKFPMVGPYDIDVTVRDEETGTELRHAFVNRVTVPEPATIELIQDLPRVPAGDSYRALFEVRDAAGQALEGFQVKLSVGQWEWVEVESGYVLAGEYGRSDFIPFDQFKRSSRGQPFKISMLQAKSVASDPLNADLTDGRGRARCVQRLEVPGAYGVSAIVLLYGHQFLTKSFSDLGSPSFDAESLQYEGEWFYKRVANGWKKINRFQPSEPPPYRVQVFKTRHALCDTPPLSRKEVEVARRLKPPDVRVFSLTHSFPRIKGEKELFQTNFLSNTTTSLNPAITWHPAVTIATDVGIPMITVKFLDGDEDWIKDAWTGINRWNILAGAGVGKARVRLLKVKPDQFADVRITFDRNKLPEPGTETSPNTIERPLEEEKGIIVGRAQKGFQGWVTQVIEHIPSAGDLFADALFDWAGFKTVREQLVQKAKEDQNLPNVWLDPDWSPDATNRKTDMEGVAAHEIGHILGFYHPENVVEGGGALKEKSGGPIEVPTAESDKDSIMTAKVKSGTDPFLSIGDVEALKNGYGHIPPYDPVVTYLTGTMSVIGNDDEMWWPDDKYKKLGFEIGIYVGSHGYKTEIAAAPLGHFKWGGELRLEVDIKPTGNSGLDSIEMEVILRLYEGASEETNNKVGDQQYTFWVHTDGRKHSYTSDPRHVLVSASLFHQRYITKTVFGSAEVWDRRDFRNNWAEVTFDLKVDDPNARPIINEDLVLSAPAFFRPINPTANLLSAADINGDGQIDAQDLILISNAIGHINLVNPHFDVNSDQAITIADLIQVAQYLGQSVHTSAPVRITVPVALTYETVEGWIHQARLEDDGSLVFQQGIAKLEYLLTLIIPEETALLHNYPNPFNPETWIPYHLAKPADVTLTLYSVDGKVVRHLDLGHQAAGYYHSKSRAAHWDGRNAVGERVASGIYFYTLTAGDFFATQKMLILK